MNDQQTKSEQPASKREGGSGSSCNDLLSRVSKLPKWAQRLIEQKDCVIDNRAREIECLRRAHAVLFEYEGWFTIKGPPTESVNREDRYNLFFLANTGAHPACSLGRHDILLVGRRSEAG